MWSREVGLGRDHPSLPMRAPALTRALTSLVPGAGEGLPNLLRQLVELEHLPNSSHSRAHPWWWWWLVGPYALVPLSPSPFAGLEVVVGARQGLRWAWGRRLCDLWSLSSSPLFAYSGAVAAQALWEVSQHHG